MSFDTPLVTPADASQRWRPCSAKELSAYANLVLTNLPFPPLPVVVAQGEDGADGTASSHDLLHSVIACEVLHPSEQGASTSGARKLEIMLALQKAVVEAFARDPHNVAALYDIYTDFFRQYLALYPSSPDLRFWPLSHVANHDPIVQQAFDHIAAYNSSMLSSGEGDGEAGGSKPALVFSSSYSDAIIAYARTAASIGV